MPELPEVQTIVTDLEPILPGNSFTGIESSHQKAITGSYSPEQFIGKKVIAVERRGKFIVISFDSDLVLTVHLRMSGRLLIRELNDQPLKYERHRLDFDSLSLRFCDQRKFGRIWFSNQKTFADDSGISRLGVEPFSRKFSKEYFYELLDHKTGPIKKHLLDQSLVAGIGNIYADEACFYAKIRPDARTENLSKDEVNRLFEAIIRALKQGIRNRGTSISNYADAFGSTGRNQEEVYVYGRKNQPCLECQTPLTGIRLVGRGTVYCPSCQNLASKNTK